MSQPAATLPIPIPAPPAGVRLIAELPAGDPPLYLQPEWAAAFPWLCQGTTGRGEAGLDLGLFGNVPTGVAQERWRRLRVATGMAAAVHARQVHEAAIRWHDHPEPGLTVGDAADGHATGAAGVLLTVSVADCVPVFLVSPGPRALAVLHAGWRGTAAGILERGVALLEERCGSPADQLYLHCGPAICGRCYEVGPEVPAALGLDGCGRPERVLLDLRAVLARRALRAGLRASRVTLSDRCTRCGGNAFWSHRGGCRERQLGIAGIRPA